MRRACGVRGVRRECGASVVRVPPTAHCDVAQVMSIIEAKPSNIEATPEPQTTWESSIYECFSVKDAGVGCFVMNCFCSPQLWGSAMEAAELGNVRLSRLGLGLGLGSGLG